MAMGLPAWERLGAEWGALYEPLPGRTGPYDALLSRRERLNPAEDGYEAARLARDHAARVDYWRERLGAPLRGTGRDARPMPGRLRDLDRLLTLAGSVAVVGLVAMAWRTSWPVAALAAVGVGSTVLALMLATRGAGRPRLGEALQRGLCPDCGYDLAGLPPALPAWVLAGADVGPAACPECGSPWPRVPPPTPRGSKDQGDA